MVALESYDPAVLDSTPGVEFYPGIICRGFVNMHCHSELSYLRGAIEPNCGYTGFAATMAQVRGNFTDQQRSEALAEADREMQSEGIVAVADIVNDSSSFATKSASPIRYRSFAEVFGLKQSNLEHCQQLAEHFPDTTLTPHSVYSVQEDDFQAVCRSATTPLSIHFKESQGEEQLFENSGALAEWYEQAGFNCDFLHYNSAAERIVANIPHDRSTIFVHNSHLTQSDIELIMSHFTAPVYWVLCPRSNRYIAGSTTDTVDLLVKNKLNICIGTDSLASNTSLSIIEELKCFAHIPLEQLLTWATTNGFNALGLKPHGWLNICGADLQNMRITEQTTVKRIL